MKKYELTDETISHLGRTLHRIRALRDFDDFEEGHLGGFIESEKNLSHERNCWVNDDAKVFGNAKVLGDAWVYGNATVCDNALVFDKADISDNAFVGNGVLLNGDAIVCGNARIERISDYIVFKNWWSSGRTFTWTRSNNMWRVGCFYGTGEELIKKAYKDSEESGREYERVVRYVESILADEQSKGGEE